MSTNWRVNSLLVYIAPWFSSPLLWYHQHVIGHHAYTNLPGKDPDLYHAPSVWRFTPEIRWRASHGWQSLTTPLLWAMGVPTLLFIKPILALRSGFFNRVVHISKLPLWRIGLHALGRALVFASLYVWPFYAFPENSLKALAFSILPISVYSLWFMAWSQINHHSLEASAHNSEVVSRNWYRHQAATSQSVAPQSRLAFLLSGGLNLQAEHHLFPTVNHAHLVHLQPHIQAAALAHGVRYPVSDTVWGAFLKLFSFLSHMGVKPSLGGVRLEGGVGTLSPRKVRVEETGERALRARKQHE